MTRAKTSRRLTLGFLLAILLDRGKRFLPCPGEWYWGGETLLLHGLRSLADSLGLFPPLRRGGGGGETGTAGYLACRLRRFSRARHRCELPRTATHPPCPPFARGGKRGPADWR